MEILILLIPVSAILVAFAVAIFFWAAHHGQFENLDNAAIDALDESIQHRRPAISQEEKHHE